MPTQSKRVSIADIRKDIGGIPRKFNKAVKGVLEKTGESILRTLKKPGRRPTYPINWDTPKQQRFVLGNFESPYKRTAKTRNAWKMKATSASVVISNKKGHAVFLYGSVTGKLPGAVHVLPTGQSHIHEGRYPLSFEVIRDNTKNLMNRIIHAISRQR